MNVHRGAARLGRGARVRSPRHFAEAFEHSSGTAGRYMVVWSRRGEEASGRVGVIASKRTFRRAVDRNRARRLLREVFRLNRSRLVCQMDYILVARRRILNAGPVDLENDLMALAERIGAIEERAV